MSWKTNRRGVIACAMLALATQYACYDAPTQPQSSVLAPRTPSQVDSPDEATATLPTADYLTGDQGNPGNATGVGFYPNKTVVQATATGMITETGGQPGWPSNSWGPAGRSPTDYTGIGLQWRAGTGYITFGFRSVTPWPGQAAASVSTYLTVWQDVSAWGSGRGAITDYSFHCGPPASGYPTPCYTYSGSGAVSLTRVASNLALYADSVVVAPGSTVVFTISQTQPFVSNSATDSIALPLDGVKAIWIPDDSAQGGLPSEQSDSSASACAFANSAGRSCSRVIRGSGTLTYVAIVNGVEQRESAHVSAQEKLTLTASKRNVLEPGDSVNFTATGSGVLVVQGWSFTPDPQSRQSPGTWGACEPGVDTCRNLVSQSGTVEVVGTVDGVSLSDTVHVTVVPCPTGDSLVDNEVVRQGLAFLMDKSRVPDPINRREHGALIYQDTITKEIFFIEYQGLGPTACTFGADFDYLVRVPSTAKRVGHAHSHPFQRNEVIPPRICPKAPKGGIGGPEGPSAVDDTTARDYHLRQYVIDRDSIYRTDGPGLRWSRPRAWGTCADILPPKPTPSRIPLDPIYLQRTAEFSPIRR